MVFFVYRLEGRLISLFFFRKKDDESNSPVEKTLDV